MTNPRHTVRLGARRAVVLSLALPLVALSACSSELITPPSLRDEVAEPPTPTTGDDRSAKPSPSTTPPRETGSSETPSDESPRTPEATTDATTEEPTTADTTPEPESPGGEIGLAGAYGDHWSGGAIVASPGSAQDPSKTPLKFWIPGQSGMTTCEVDLYEADEEAPNWGKAVLMATTGADPALAVAYTAFVPASGLDPQTARAYLQTVDPDTCGLGDRVALTEEMSGENVSELRPEFVGFSDNVLAVKPYRDGYVLDSSTILGVDLEDGSIRWEETFSEQAVRAVALAPGMVAIQRSSGSDEHVDVETGDLILKTGDDEFPGSINASAWRMDDESFLVEIRREFWRVSPGTAELVSGGEPTSGTPRLLTHHEDGERVLVSMFYPEDAQPGETDSYLGYVDAAGDVHEILSTDEVSSLGVRLLGAGQGLVWIETSSETFAIELDGSMADDAGSGRMKAEGDRFFGDTAWTRWVGGSGENSRIMSTERGYPSEG